MEPADRPPKRRRHPSRKRLGLEVTVTWSVRRRPDAAALLRRVAAFAARAEGFRSGRLSVVVVGRMRMAGLHKRYAGVRGPTDVLTFDLGTDRRRWIEGEIVVCIDVAARRGRTGAMPKRSAGSGAMPKRSAGMPRAVQAELALYVVHGILHLAGYDDHTAAGFRRMHVREDELLTRFGIGRVFDPPRRRANAPID